MKAKLDIRQITFAALTGALYVTLCYFGNIFGLSFGIFQCRFAEALTVLPFLCPSSAWGLFAGCILSNIISPYGLPDLIFGSLATLAAGLLTARCRNKWLAPPAAGDLQRADRRSPAGLVPDGLYRRLPRRVRLQRRIRGRSGAAGVLCAGSAAAGGPDQKPRPAPAGGMNHIT